MAQVYETLSGIGGAELLGEPEEAAWGGAFSWRGPEGNIWDVAFADGTSIDDRGGLRFPRAANPCRLAVRNPNVAILRGRFG